jgi:membrane-bound lytic murein transglycosylase B
MLIGRPSTHGFSFPQWGDVPTWVTAGVACPALIAAIVAYSKQAAAANKLPEQVEVQSEQLKDQQAANRIQAAVLEAEFRELQERAKLAEREQANCIDLQVENELHLPQEPTIHLAKVCNGLQRPIRNVRCYVELSCEPCLQRDALGERAHRSV